MKPAICCLAALLVSLSVDIVAGDREPREREGKAVIERFLAREDTPLREYRARRTLRAASPRLGAHASLEAITELTAGGTFNYRVVREEGSGSVRTRVLHAVLRDEKRTLEQGDPKQSRLSADNYRFTFEPGGGAMLDATPTEPGELLIGITPRRSDVLLVDGTIAVDASGDLLRVEGRLAKNPSFWTSRVEVVRRYARIAGVRVPVSTTSVAQVKIAGKSEFEMTYKYESINGKTVP